MLDGTDGQLRVLLLENIHPDAAARLGKDGYHVETASRALAEDELIEAIGGVQLLGIRSGTHVTERVLAAAPDLLAVGAFCIGVNQIDLPAASRRGIAVFNAPFSNTRSVVELALAEIIAMTRRLTDKNAQMHAGVWDKSAAGSHEVRGRRLGIVGYGNIGGQLSVLAEALGMTVFFYDTADKLALGNARRCGTLEELLELSDVVTLHVDGRPGNSGLFGEAEFAAMRPGSLFLNLSRGFVVDHAALRAQHRVRQAGRGGGGRVPRRAARPRRGVRLRAARPAQRHPDPARRRLDRGGAAGHRRVRGRQAARLRRCGATSLSVNLPGVALPHTPGTHRLVHLHRNIPGVLATINQVLAEHRVNIEGQLLGTRDELGYVLTDVGTEYTDDMLASLRDLDVTIRLRTTRPA